MRVIACALLVIAATYAAEDRCNPGKSFMNNCNFCVCPDDGYAKNAMCTQMLCDTNANENSEGAVLRERRQTELRCVPGQAFKNYCNTCICQDDGNVDNARCTRMDCSGNHWNKDGTLKTSEGLAAKPLFREIREAEFSCQPQKSFKKDCNTCVCSADGKSAACTMKACTPSQVNAPAQVCEPGNSFKVDCNQCVCSEDGLEVFCTKMACNGKKVKRSAPVTDKAPYCEPNSYFPNDCNICRCNEFGTNAACTAKECL